MRAAFRDFARAVRPLLRRRGFAAAAVTTMALGIGGNAAVFSIVDRILVRPLPFPDASRLVRVTDTLLAPGGQLYRPQVLPWHWQGIVDQAKSLDRAIAIRPERLTWVGAEAASSFQGARVSPGAFGLLGVTPRFGRSFTPEEERLGSKSVAALISDRFWKERLGGDTGVLGGPLRLADGTATVVGILPPGFRFPYASDVWRPLSIEPSDTRDLYVLGRLRPGATLREADAELAAIARRQEQDGPAPVRGRGMEARPLAESLLAGQERIPVALMAAMGLLLALACVNLASLLLVRSIARRRETAIRAALGASRGSQIRQGLSETLILSMAGGVLGLTFAAAAAGPISVLTPRAFAEDLPAPGASLGWEVALFAFALATAIGIAAGIVPAWRNGQSDPARALSSGGRTGSPDRAAGAGSRGSWWRRSHSPFS